jgi:hypothetical protein
MLSPTSLQFARAVGFFAIIAVGGLTVFVLAVVGAVKEPVFCGACGLVAGGLASYLLSKSCSALWVGKSGGSPNSAAGTSASASEPG